MTQAEVVQSKVTIVIGVPGAWPDRTAIVQAIAEKSDGLLFAGKILMDTHTQHGFELDIYGRDPNLRQAFAFAGSHWVTDADLAQIDAHQHTLYVLGPGGNLSNAREMMEVALGLLKADGLAVKVESTGKAHSRRDWEAMCAGKGPLVVYDAYVVFSVSGNTVYSCGMHALGYQDAILTSHIPPQEAVGLLDTFLKYLLVEQPALSEGHTFAEGPDAPAFRLSLESCTLAPSDDLFYNPFGLWRLTPI